MTAQEREILIDAEIPATQRHNCILMWITRIFIEGRQAGHFTGGSGIEQQFMEKIHVIRSQYGAIGDELQGRMPLAYAHIVQVLVDCVLLMYPLMAFSSGMSPFLGVVGTGLLTTSYQGLFDLAKQFLDPYDNENYGKGEDPLCVDTLIAETNAGSLRWMYGFEQMPVSSQRIKDGELFDYLLPVRGYTVEELEKMESDRLQKEKEMKEKREREEAERIKAGEEARRKKEAEELESIAEEEALEGMLEVDRQKDVNVTAVDENPIKTKDRSKKQLARQVGENATVAAEQQPAKASNLTPSLAKKFARDSKQVPSISDSNTTENLPDSKPVIHRVTSLEGGLPVSLAGTTDNSQNVTQSNIPMISVPQSKLLARNATASKFEDINVDSDFAESKKEASPDIGSEAVDGSEQEEDLELVEEVQNEEDDELYVGFDSFQDLPWFDEVGPDGQEVRLSQLLAEEEWEEEKAYKEEKERITYEEFRMRSAEIVERAESEFLETEQIMMAAPGAQDGQTLLKEEKTLKTVMYDQTKLDGISQLWGLPPDDPDDIPGYEIPDTPVEESTFEGISYLWGRAPETPNDGTSSYIEEESFDGTSISELWGDRIDGSGDEEQGFGRSEDPSSHSWGDEAQYSDKYNERIDSNEEDYDLDSTIDSYGLPSWDDGSGDRLSQILADEMWEDEVADAPELDWESPITTLEEYEKKVAELSNEIKETEAILNAPPGADSTERDDDEAEDGETLEQSVDLQNSENQTDATEDWNDGDDDLDALGMDVSPTDVLPANSSIYNATDVTVLDPVPSEEITNTTKAKGDATLQNITIEDESSNDKADGDSDDAPIEGENHA